MPKNSNTERGLPEGSRWRAPFNIVQTNLQEIDVDMDVESALDAIKDYGGDTWLLNAGGIMSFYPTDLPFQTRNPLLARRPSGDLLGDAVTAAKRRGVKVIARFDMSKVSARIAGEHPEWLYYSPNGGPQVYNTLFSTCPSGEYYQARAFDVIDEVLDRYEVDAIFFNWFNFNERDYDEVTHGACHCAACQKGFAEFSGGLELPSDMKSDTFGPWRAYVGATLAELTARIVDHVSARERDVGVVLRSGAPIVYLEGNNAYRAMPGKELWPHATAEAVSAHVSSRPDAAVMVNSVAFIDATYRMGSEQPEHFAQYLVQALARGGNPSAYSFGAPGRLPMQWSISQGREIMRFRRANATLYRDLKPAATIALVRPSMATAEHGAYWDALEEFRGLYASLLEAHVPFDVVPIDELQRMGERGLLTRYELLILPDAGTLGESAAQVDDFVYQGGKLLTTGSSGLSRSGALELSCAPALHALTPALSDTELRSTYVTSATQPRIDEFRYEAPIIPVYGRYQRYIWKPGTDKTGFLLPKAPFGPPEIAYGHRGSADPDHVRGRFGAGEVVHIPWTIGRTYREFGKSDVRDHFSGILQSLVSPRITADMHDAVEVIAGAAGEKAVVHLINHTGARRRSYGPHVPISGGHLRLIGLAADARVDAMVAGIQLEARSEGAEFVVELPTIQLFEVIVIDSTASLP
ncbi:alpha-amylase family protein [Phytoactinopolyspora endophytica]|uniref:alpha-amylase family protein n=1 Tax=Phytoactinopolyspora endophytica TaxID=1642495 RepID=UPI00197BC203|nr:alpha-amylase family protein [Phytoactinopolyspora endophytica]